MITTELVKATMQRWECAGLMPPVSLLKAPKMMVESFLERFAYMDEPTLEYVTAKVILGEEWPKYSTVEQLAKEYASTNHSFIQIDYFKQLRLRAFGEKETFQEFVERIAEKYFPGKAKEWIHKYSFTLMYYGVSCKACENCQGKCGYNGHRLELRIKRGSSCPVPWRSLELCEKFKASVDGRGRSKARPRSIVEQAAEREEAMSGFEDVDLDKLIPGEENIVKESYVQQNVFSEGGELDGVTQAAATP